MWNVSGVSNFPLTTIQYQQKIYMTRHINMPKAVSALVKNFKEHLSVIYIYANQKRSITYTPIRLHYYYRMLNRFYIVAYIIM